MKIIGQVERVSRLSVETFREKFLCRSPVVITDAMGSWNAMNWSIQKLKVRFGNAKIPVRMDDDEFNAYCDATNDLTLRDSKEAQRLTAKELSFWVINLDAYFNAAIRGGSVAKRLPYLMDVPLSRSIIASYLRVLKIDTAEDWDPLISALETLIADVAFPEYLTGAKDFRFWFTPRPRQRGIIHADGYHNLNAQIRGRKEWILVSPDQANNLYRSEIKPQESDNPAKVSDMEEHQKFGEVEGFSCIIHEGEMLYIPARWWHAAAALESCLNINAWHMPPA